MSIVQTKGESIIQATKILRETYKNLKVLFEELDRVGEEEGYVTINPRFMRYKSDNDTTGWLTTNFIKLYVKSDVVPEHIEDIRELAWYGVMVDLTNEFDAEIPMVSIIKYQFNQSYWNRLPSVSDHWTFWSPFSAGEFSITGEEDEWKVDSNHKAMKRHSGFERLVAKDIPLFDLKNQDDVREKVFGEFVKLSF